MIKCFIYETINLLNGKKYIGAHKTQDINDGYMGSGKILKEAFRKYGKQNFSFRILKECTDSASMYSLERDLVNEEWISRKDTYNLKLGGSGGFDYINKYALYNTPEAKLKLHESLKKAHKEGKFSYPPSKYKGVRGRYKHSEETIRKISGINNHYSLKKEEIDRRRILILESGIDFSKYGWATAISLLINIKPQKVNLFMKKYMSDFYDSKCFKRK